MAKFHINNAGEAGACAAIKGNCPFGGEDDHFTSAEAARASYEKTMAPATLSTVRVPAKDRPFRVPTASFTRDSVSYEETLQTAETLKAAGRFVVIVSTFIDRSPMTEDDEPPKWDDAHPILQTVDEFSSKASGYVRHSLAQYRDEEHFQQELAKEELPSVYWLPTGEKIVDYENSGNGFYATHPTARKNGAPPTYMELRVV